MPKVHDLSFCPACGAKLSGEESTCPLCAYRLSDVNEGFNIEKHPEKGEHKLHDYTYCPQCGAVLKGIEKVCPICGYDIIVVAEEEIQKEEPGVIVQEIVETKEVNKDVVEDVPKIQVDENPEIPEVSKEPEIPLAVEEVVPSIIKKPEEDIKEPIADVPIPEEKITQTPVTEEKPIVISETAEINDSPILPAEIDNDIPKKKGRAGLIIFLLLVFIVIAGCATVGYLQYNGNLNIKFLEGIIPSKNKLDLVVPVAEKNYYFTYCMMIKGNERTIIISNVFIQDNVGNSKTTATNAFNRMVRIRYPKDYYNYGDPITMKFTDFNTAQKERQKVKGDYEKRSYKFRFVEL